MLLYTTPQMPSARTQKPDATNRPQLAAAINTVKYHLHGQHILDRLLDGYGWNGTYHHPQMDLVGIYIDQAGAGDLSAERAERHPAMQVYPTIVPALTLGSPLVHNMEQIFLTGKTPYPVERTLPTNGILIAGIDSLFQGQLRVPTPHLAINYQPNPESTFWRS